MERRIPFLSLLAPVFLLWLVLACFFVDVNGDQALVKDTCNKTSVPSFCVSLLLTNSSSLTADVFGLAVISTRLLISNITKAQPVVAELQRKATEPLLKSVLTDCNNEYLSGIQWGENGLSDLFAKDFNSANIDVGGVSDSTTGCEDVFEEFNLTYPPVLRGFQHNVLSITKVALPIINLL